MLKIAYEMLLYIFALYGLIAVIRGALKLIRYGRAYRGSRARLVLMVKNQENSVEGIIRSILQEDLPREIVPDGKLTVLDMGSTDETMKIVEKLQKEYEMIDILREDDKEKLFLHFNSQKDNTQGNMTASNFT